MKTRVTLICLIVLMFTISGFAQNIEYGKPSELKGLKKIYLDTETDLKNRERIIGEIEKAKLPVEFVEEFNQAEIFMLFRGEVNDVVTGGSTVSNDGYSNTNINTEKLASGTGMVTIRGKSSDKPRLIISVQNSQDTKLEKKPSIKFAKEFIKQYKLANDMK